MPFFSVCIPLYNKANFIAKTLQSVVDQNFKNFEILICDDGSTDHSVAKVNKFKDERIKLIQQDNQGAASARNKTIQASSGEYIAFLDADDLWQKNHLNTLYQLICDYWQAKLFATNYKIQSLNGKHRLPFFSHLLKTGFVDDYFFESLSDPVMTCFNSAVHHSVFKEIGDFNSDYRTGQDVDFAIKANLNFRLAYHEEPTVIYHQTTENNLAKTQFNQDRLAYIQAYDDLAKKHKSLAHYLAVNRFALILKSKQAGDDVWKEAKKGLDVSCLNKKQKILLKCSGNQLRLLKKAQLLLSESGLYLSPFKN